MPTAVPSTIPPALADVAASELTAQAQMEGLPHSAVGETKQANAEGEEEFDEVCAGFEMVPAGVRLILPSGGVGVVAANPIACVDGTEAEYFEIFDSESHIFGL